MLEGGGQEAGNTLNAIPLSCGPWGNWNVREKAHSIGHHYKSEYSLHPSPLYCQSSLDHFERDEVPGRILKVRSTISGKLSNCMEVFATAGGGALGKDMWQGRGSQIVHFLAPNTLCSCFRPN